MVKSFQNHKPSLGIRHDLWRGVAPKKKGLGKQDFE
jgi:hypothetical protein